MTKRTDCEITIMIAFVTHMQPQLYDLHNAVAIHNDHAPNIPVHLRFAAANESTHSAVAGRCGRRARFTGMYVTDDFASSPTLTLNVAPELEPRRVVHDHAALDEVVMHFATTQRGGRQKRK
uniref:Uncharacterized protein n=1 Tax=Lygus hesperus TaxID=30085 RepID=A0A146LBI9_LYGHE